MNLPVRPPRGIELSHKLTGMLQEGMWGRGYDACITINQAEAGQEFALPLGGLERARKVYIYLDCDATLVLNGRHLPMVCTRLGFWEFLADMTVVSLALRAEGRRAHGKYCVFG